MDVMRAAILGAAGTPYHDQLFFFDIQLSPDHPANVPKVLFHSHGNRINPNLYNDGKARSLPPKSAFQPGCAYRHARRAATVQ